MRYEQWNWFINEETGEYRTTVIKFSLPYPEWLKLQGSEAWKEVSEMVRLAQEKEHSRRYRQEAEHRKEILMKRTNNKPFPFFWTWLKENHPVVYEIVWDLVLAVCVVTIVIEYVIVF